MVKQQNKKKKRATQIPELCHDTTGFSEVYDAPNNVKS